MSAVRYILEMRGKLTSRYSRQLVWRRDLLGAGGGKSRCTPSAGPHFCAARVKISYVVNSNHCTQKSLLFNYNIKFAADTQDVTTLTKKIK